MINDNLTSCLTRRFDAARNPIGRSLLEFHVAFQRLRAQWLVYGTPALKRTVDIAISVTLLILLTPLFALIALAVWVEDGGPIFFAQTRVGRHGRHFKMYK